MVEARMPEVADVADVADWAVAEACRLTNAVEEYSDIWGPNHVQTYAPLKAFARYIAAHEKPPVDPLLIEAIELVIADDVTRTDRQIEAIRERRAGHEKVNLALAALKRGLALAGRGEG